MQEFVSSCSYSGLPRSNMRLKIVTRSSFGSPVERTYLVGLVGVPGRLPEIINW